jgi:SAM-dependent methyltransferase
MPDARGPAVEFHVELASLAEWSAFVQAHPYCVDRRFIRETANRIATRGFYFGFQARQIGPGEVEVKGENYRETFIFAGINVRQRAVLDELMRHVGHTPPARCRIYSPEALSDFALSLRGRFARFIGSEYTEDAELRRDLYPIEVQNLLHLSLPANNFDAVLVNDVFEHVPDLSCTLMQILRILKPGGALIATFPFHGFAETTEIKAERTAEGIKYHAPPEFHEDPLNPNGALVYQIPGWDILEKCRRIGYEQAHMVYEFSEQRGIITPDFGGVFVLRAVKGPPAPGGC